MMSWRTLQETMGLALLETAEAMGFVGKTATSDLYDALQSGTVTFNEFNDKLIELNEATGGFADRAKTATKGIGTSFETMKKSVVSGATEIVKALDNNGNIRNGIESLGKGFESVLKTIGSVTSFITKFLSPAFWLLSKSIGAVTVALASLTFGFIAYKTTLVITSFIQALAAGFGILESAMLASKLVMDLVTIAQTKLNVAMSLNPIGVIVAAVAALVVGLTALYHWLSGTKKAQDELTKTADANTKSLEKNATAANGIAEAGDAITESYNSASASVKELSDTIYDSFEDAKKAADEYNKQFTNRGYMLVKDAEGRAQAIKKSDYAMYEDLQGYIDAHYKDASDAQKVSIARYIRSNK
jgi:uncharacterized protein YoxC